MFNGVNKLLPFPVQNAYSSDHISFQPTQKGNNKNSKVIEYMLSFISGIL
jgi:hypothetical protein